APRPNAARIACAGGNFADHAAAMAERMQGKPFEGDARAQIRNAGIWGFWKVHRAVVGPDGEVVYPQKANRLDYEGELAIVLAKRGTDIKPENARDHIWGVTLLGDWSISSPREPAGRLLAPVLARRHLAARPLLQPGRRGRVPLPANRQPARLGRQQEFGQIEMHRIDIPAEITARAMRARGRDHIFERIAAAR